MNQTSHNPDHGTVASYKTGFKWAAILTVIPFLLVMTGLLPKGVTLFLIVAMAIAQLYVHLKYFLHLNMTTDDGRLNTVSFVFSMIVIVLVVGLSLWIIFSANEMMMPWM